MSAATGRLMEPFIVFAVLFVIAMVLIEKHLGPPPESQRQWDYYKAAKDGLITIEHLERHLPTELPFHGHVFKRDLIAPLSRLQQYTVYYTCSMFFDCDPAARPWFPKVKLARQYGSLALRLSEEGHEHLGGSMVIDRVPPELLPEVIREQLRCMYEQLEHHVNEELELGCQIRSSGSC